MNRTTLFLAILVSACLATAAEAGHGRGRKHRAPAIEVTTTTLYQTGAERMAANCPDGTWDTIRVDDDNPSGCEYWCATPDGGLQFETLYPCPE